MPTDVITCEADVIDGVPCRTAFTSVTLDNQVLFSAMLLLHRLPVDTSTTLTCASTVTTPMESHCTNLYRLRTEYTGD